MKKVTFLLKNKTATRFFPVAARFSCNRCNWRNGQTANRNRASAEKVLFKPGVNCAVVVVVKN
jgi:hypothetical protein